MEMMVLIKEMTKVMINFGFSHEICGLEVPIFWCNKYYEQLIKVHNNFDYARNL